jgi:hypothetical protein
MFSDFFKKSYILMVLCSCYIFYENTSCYSWFTYCSHKQSEWPTMYMSKKKKTLALQIEYTHHAFERWKKYIISQYLEGLIRCKPTLWLSIPARYDCFYTSFQCWSMVILSLWKNIVYLANWLIVCSRY